MGEGDKNPLASAKRAEVEAFAANLRKTPAQAADHAVQSSSPGRGRLVFALDATMSRQPTWDVAQQVQGQMFAAASACGGLDIQLVYFRGFDECRASAFMRDGAGLAKAMAKISVMSGATQIGRVLRHIRAEQAEGRVAAFVYVGDSMEEKADALGRLAGELGLLGVKGFLFHEGGDRQAAACFKDIARLTGGAYAVFDSAAPGRLANLLKAAAAYAAGGFTALRDRARQGDAEARQLLSQMR
ncbi:VWA domain-containing protein [Rhodoblastus sp.]|uniref:VWA domain-containing protein n=1 Tax=Rhodoblastus sp. TaxID=1962975 RepID=UPI0035AE6A35